MPKAVNYQAKRQELVKRKAQLETMIQESTDQVAITLLRKDYRSVCDDLELFYDDEPKEVKP